MEILLRNIPNDFEYKFKNLHENAHQIETLIIGNSHSLYGLNPNFIEGQVFNLSQVSQSPDIDQKVLEYFVPHLPKLKTLIIRLSYDSMYEQLRTTNESWRLKDYYLYYGLNQDNVLAHKFEILAVSSKFNLKRINNYYVKKVSSIEVNPLGFGTKTKIDVNHSLEKTGPISAKKHTSDSDYYYFQNKKIYESIVSYCSNNNIDVVVVTIPTYKSYYENLNEQQLHNTINFGELLQNKYENVIYYNFLKDSSYNETHFFDADHLNEKGAQKFSLLINSLLNH